LNNYLLTDLKEKFGDQEIEITLLLPKGILFKVDKSLENYDHSDSDYFLWNPDFTEAVYKVGNDKIKCLNCPKQANDNSEMENKEETDSIVTTTVSVNGKVIAINKIEAKKES
jgi:hypothetical protein